MRPSSGRAASHAASVTQQASAAGSLGRAGSPRSSIVLALWAKRWEVGKVRRLSNRPKATPTNTMYVLCILERYSGGLSSNGTKDARLGGEHRWGGGRGARGVRRGGGVEGQLARRRPQKQQPSTTRFLLRGGEGFVPLPRQSTWALVHERALAHSLKQLRVWASPQCVAASWPLSGPLSPPRANSPHPSIHPSINQSRGSSGGLRHAELVSRSLSLSASFFLSFFFLFLFFFFFFEFPSTNDHQAVGRLILDRHPEWWVLPAHHHSCFPRKQPAWTGSTSSSVSIARDPADFQCFTRGDVSCGAKAGHFYPSQLWLPRYPLQSVQAAHYPHQCL